jgi:hypothetical protein
MMSDNDMGRADPIGADLDLSGFRPEPAKAAAVNQEAIRKLSEASGFPSREPERGVTYRPVVRRVWRTGRNLQLSVKVTADTLARFNALADKRGIPFGELVKQLLDELGV